MLRVHDLPTPARYAGDASERGTLRELSAFQPPTRPVQHRNRTGPHLFKERHHDCTRSSPRIANRTHVRAFILADIRCLLSTARGNVRITTRTVRATRPTRSATISRAANFSKAGSTSSGGDDGGELPEPPRLRVLAGRVEQPTPEGERWLGEPDGLQHASVFVERLLARLGGAR